MRIKVVWLQPIWLNDEEIGPWEEADVDEATATMLEAKRMVVIMDAPPVVKRGPGRPKKEAS